ncbi:unnamed protein product [Parnassius apollo]|uniref:(apollo) hypothetical protein n=1 Tax=Parnassius apollo TaxID=110799 RepID=A0A8S3X7K5_PARAO|nr:unnamed protein product [Parnassius apollo]
MATDKQNGHIPNSDNKNVSFTQNETSDDKAMFEEGIKENVTINIDNSEGGKTDICQNGKIEEKNGLHDDNNKLDVSKDLLGAPRGGHRMSFMEEESAKEKMRLSLLKQCSAILKQGDQWYNKESLHRTFQDEVSLEI